MNRSSCLRWRVRHRGYLWLVLLAVLAVEIIIFRLSSWPIKTLAVVVGGTWAVFSFRHQDHLQTARFCKELVTEFNNRYDAINEDLQKLVQHSGEFSEDDILAFVDYFNLCAEEYLFHEAGYIYDEIWESWHNGMKHYARDSRVASIWAVENKTNSYYGFKLPVERSVAAIQ